MEFVVDDDVVRMHHFSSILVTFEESWTHVELSRLKKMAALGLLMVPLNEGGGCASWTPIFIAFGWRVWKLLAVCHWH